jgi:acetylornithine aminotransferase
LPELKKNLLLRQHIFTGEAKPNVIRLLPSLALTQTDASKFIASLQQEIQSPSS